MNDDERTRQTKIAFWLHVEAVSDALQSAHVQAVPVDISRKPGFEWPTGEFVYAWRIPPTYSPTKMQAELHVSRRGLRHVCRCTIW